jgi:hypothetical protein
MRDCRLQPWSQRRHATIGRQHGTKTAIAVQPCAASVALALQIILYRWLPRDLQNRLVAHAYLAVSAVHYQGGQRRVTPAVCSVYDPDEDLTDPVAKRNGGANAGHFLNCVRKLAVCDDCVIGVRDAAEHLVRLSRPDFVGFVHRQGRTIGLPPVTAPFHDPILADRWTNFQNQPQHRRLGILLHAMSSLPDMARSLSIRDVPLCWLCQPEPFQSATATLRSIGPQRVSQLTVGQASGIAVRRARMGRSSCTLIAGAGGSWGMRTFPASAPAGFAGETLAW